MTYIYTQHHDFIQSIFDFYQKNTNYRKAAQLVLAALAKSNYPNIFKHQEVFYGLQRTHNGENRIRHCIKYNLYHASRLVTLENQDTCVFLFLGTHEEADLWISKNHGLTIDSFKKQKEPLKYKTNDIVNHVENEKNQKAKLKSLLYELEENEKKITDYIDLLELKKEYFFQQKNQSTYKKLKSDFISINKPEFIFRLENLKNTTYEESKLPSIEDSQHLELHTELIQLKVKYIHLFKEYVYLAKTVH